jgi:hypothetical protein
VQRAGAVTPEMVDALLRSEDFVAQASRWHADLLWPNLDQFPHPGGRAAADARRRQPRGDRRPPRRAHQRGDVPATGNGNLTAVSCCTLVRTRRTPRAAAPVNERVHPDDPACVEKSRRLGAAYTAGQGIGDRGLRGGSGSTGCDDTLEYPPAARAARRGALAPRRTVGPTTSRRARGSAGTTTTRTTSRCPTTTGRTAPTTAARTGMGTGATGASSSRTTRQGARDVAAARCSATRRPRCPAGYEEVVNTCDNGRQRQRLQRASASAARATAMVRPYWSPRALGEGVRVRGPGARQQRVHGRSAPRRCALDAVVRLRPRAGVLRALAGLPEHAARRSAERPRARGAQRGAAAHRAPRSSAATRTTTPRTPRGGRSSPARSRRSTASRWTRVSGLALTPPAEPAARSRASPTRTTPGASTCAAPSTPACSPRRPSSGASPRGGRASTSSARPSCAGPSSPRRGPARARRRVQPRAQPRRPLRLPALPLGHRAPRRVLGSLGASAASVPRPRDLPRV